MPRINRAVGTICFLLSGVGACGGSGGDATAPPVAHATSVNLSSAGEPKVVAGGTLQLNAVVLDQNGNSLPGAPVTYASTDQAVAKISSTGLLTAIGPVGSATITAASGGVTSNALVVSVIAGPPQTIVAIRGQSQNGKPAGAPADSLFVRVNDAFGNPAPAVTVAWVASGGSTLASPTTVTDAAGVTSNVVTLGATPSSVSVTASLSGGASATFAIVSVAPAFILTRVAGDQQRGVIGFPLGDSLVVRVTDAANNVLSGATVTWELDGGSIGVTISDAGGLARVAAVPRAASSTVTAQAGTATASFTEQASPLVPCDLAAPDATGQHWQNEAPTDYTIFARPSGTVKAVMVFVDFSDAPASEPTTAYSDAIVPDAVDFYREASYGRMTFSVTPVAKWYRMPQPSSAYGIVRGSLSFATHRAYMAAAMALADPDVDFSQYSHVYVVASKGSQVQYSPGFTALPGTGVMADGHELRFGAALGGDLWAYSPIPNYGAHIFAHETGHTFGLPDLYSFGTVTDYYALYDWAGGWDIMSWTVPGAHFFAWQKNKLGWLNADEKACFEHGRAEVTIAPTESPGGLKLVAVKLDASHAIAAEVRQATGHDTFAHDHGVLLYRVDATAPTGGTASGAPIVLIPAGNGTDSTAIKSVGPHYDATFGLDAGKQGTFTDSVSGVTIQLRGMTNGAYRLVIGRP